MDEKAKTAWYVVAAHGDGAHTKTVRGLAAVEETICGMIYMDAGDMTDDERAGWHRVLNDEDEWCSFDADGAPWYYSITFEDGSISVQRLSDDDPAVVALNVR